MYKRCKDIRRLKQDDEFKYRTCINPETDTAEGCPAKLFNGQYLEVTEMFYLSVSLAATGVLVVCVWIYHLNGQQMLALWSKREIIFSFRV